MPILRPLIVMAVFGLLAIFVSNWYYIGVVLLAFDTRARHVDYKRHKHLKWSPHLGDKFRRSWCSRGVAMSIWGEDAEKYFTQRGYLFYHIFPQGFPMVFFTKRMWKSIFFGLG